jgi:hypothetical protein
MITIEELTGLILKVLPAGLEDQNQGLTPSRSSAIQTGGAHPSSLRVE